MIRRAIATGNRQALWLAFMAGYQAFVGGGGLVDILPVKVVSSLVLFGSALSYATLVYLDRTGKPAPTVYAPQLPPGGPIMPTAHPRLAAGIVGVEESAGVPPVG